MFRNLVSSARVATLRATRTSALRWRVQRRFEAWTFFRGPCTGKCDASQDARLAQPWWRRATHWDAALQHPQARQFKQKLAKFCNIPRSECPSCPARRAATFDASCLHLLCVVLPYTGQEGQGQAQSQGQGQSEGAMTICIVMSLPLQAEFVFRHVLKPSTSHFLRSLCLGAA